MFHQSGLPHVVIVSNGADFGEKRGVTHFSATKGLERNWKCVGADIQVGEMWKMSGFKEGREYMIDKLYVKEKEKLLDSAKKMAMNIQGLCQDLNALCVRRNQIFKEMAQMRINVDDFKRFDTFYYEVAPTEVEPEPVHKKKHKKKKEHREEKGEKSKRSARSCGQFPADVRSKLISEAISDIDKESEQVIIPQESKVDEFTRSRPGGCRIKNARPRFPLLPQISETVGQNPDEWEAATTTVKDLKQWAVSEEPNNPYNLNHPQTTAIDKAGIVEEHPISPEAEFVVTKQPQRSQDEIFTRKRPTDETSENQSKRQRSNGDEEVYYYSKLPVSKKMFEILENQRMEEEACKLQELKEKLQEDNHAQVHEPHKPDETIDITDDHDNMPEMAEVISLDDEQITTEGTVNTLGGIWEDPIFDNHDNIIGFKNQPDFRVFIP